jgi:hypothetical protein
VYPPESIAPSGLIEILIIFELPRLKSFASSLKVVVNKFFGEYEPLAVLSPTAFCLESSMQISLIFESGLNRNLTHLPC